MARRRGGASFGHQVRRQIVAQVPRLPMNRCGSFSALRPYVCCSVFSLIHHRGLYLCPCPCLHLRLCPSVYPVLCNLACWCIRAQEGKERPSLSLYSNTSLSIYVHYIHTQEGKEHPSLDVLPVDLEAKKPEEQQVGVSCPCCKVKLIHLCILRLFCTVM
jgi:hypothetical protein